MNNIVGIGANVYDTLITLKSYPREDTKMQCEHIRLSGGGPCATGLVAAGKLGEKCAFIGNLADDSGGEFLKADFEKFGVSTEFCDVKKGYKSFSSYIWLGSDKATRTIVFDKGDLPPTEISEKAKTAIENAKVLMVDGNDLDAAVEGAKIAKESGVKVLYDAGGLYEGIEKLIIFADILIPSEEFAIKFTGAKNAVDAAKLLYDKYSPEVVVITQGKNGGVIYDGKDIKEYPAFLVDAVDTNGSGDVFHGAFAFAVTKGYNMYKSCVFSSAVSALKCTKTGARDAVPSFSETVNFLKERGYNEF